MRKVFLCIFAAIFSPSLFAQELGEQVPQRRVVVDDQHAVQGVVHGCLGPGQRLRLDGDVRTQKDAGVAGSEDQPVKKFRVSSYPLAQEV